MSTTSNLIRIKDLLINLDNVKTIRLELGQVVFTFTDNKDFSISGREQVEAVTAWFKKEHDISVPHKSGTAKVTGF